MTIDNNLAKLSEDLDVKSTKYDDMSDAFAGVATTVGGAISGAVGATLGLPTDLVGIINGLKDAATAEDGKRLDAFADGFTEFSKENLGSQYYKDVFNNFVDSLDVDDVLKNDAKAGFSAGEFVTPPIAGGGAVKAVSKIDKIKDEFSRAESMAMKAKENATRKVDEIGKEFNGKAPKTYTRSEVMAMTAKREPSPVRQLTKLEQVISDVPKADADKLDDVDLYKFMGNFESKYDDFDLALEQSKLPKEQLNKAEIDFMDRMSNIDKIYTKRREKNLAKYKELDNHAESADYKFTEAMDSAYDNAAETVDETAEEIFGRTMSKEELLPLKERGNLIFDNYFFSSLDSILADMNLTEDYNFFKNLDDAVAMVQKTSKEVPPLEIGSSKFALEGKLKSNLTSDSLDMFDDKAKGATAGSTQANNLIGAPVKDGEKVGIRKNLNSKSLDGEKGVLQTIHKNNYNGKALSYQPYATVENVTFNVNQSHRRRIASKAKGLAVPESSAKFNMASVDGKYVSDKNLLRDGYETEIAFNPAQGHLFIDVNTGQAVKGAETATVVGDRVFANGVTYWKKSDAPKPLDASDGTKLTGEVRYKFRKGGLMARN